MGGSASIEFMVELKQEKMMLLAVHRGYSANVERASAALPAIENREGLDAPESFPAPDIRTIAALIELGALQSIK